MLLVYRVEEVDATFGRLDYWTKSCDRYCRQNSSLHSQRGFSNLNHVINIIWTYSKRAVSFANSKRSLFVNIGIISGSSQGVPPTTHCPLTTNTSDVENLDQNISPAELSSGAQGQGKIHMKHIFRDLFVNKSTWIYTNLQMGYTNGY